LRIDGKVKGNITAKGEANSTLVLSEHAVIVGNVTVPHIISNGTIKGTVRASERVELQPRSEIAGDVHYKVIEMAFGAVVNGNLIRELSEEVKDQSSVSRLKPVVTSGEGENATG
jgi:cytoskeletal protein CcmA (bactofilin family)